MHTFFLTVQRVVLIVLYANYFIHILCQENLYIFTVRWLSTKTNEFYFSVLLGLEKLLRRSFGIITEMR